MSTLCERKADISVIVPVYNLERHLAPLLATLKEQDLGDYTAEYIFVLNNCTDNSEGVIRDSGLPCRILNCTQQGCGPARNVGVDQSDSEYIWFMDGDDWLLSKTAIKDVLDKAKAEDLNVLRIPFESNYFQRQYFSMVWQYLFKRSFVKGLRFPAIQPSEDDVYTGFVLYMSGYDSWTYLRMPSMDRPLYYYNYLREGSNMYRVTVLHESI